MEMFSLTGLLVLLQILIIDILLAGDNAIVIGMAAKNLQPKYQKRAIFWGTVGAIILRLVMAFLFIEAINTIPALRLVGGVLLLWIAYKLLLDQNSDHTVQAKDSLLGAITTIIIADGIMGVDNVLGVVGAADGHMTFVAIGMLITVPIIVWGSTLFVDLIERYPIILYVGGAILAWVGAGMMLEDPIVESMLSAYQTIISVACVILVVGAAIITNRLKKA
ncbi:YjbE family putative metal transport protein [Veillonella montpellierensis]|uniref:YjbE family putative metal transport protein n=1 Tax=Veillonella montpellierensis TaxID=187328 RepID=UPI0023F7849E|nr:YjbE family putative metal transport protein [Veillonella montpellierensis]